MKCLVMLGIYDTFNETYDYLVGVDRGALFLAQANREMDLAVGDFDSVNAEEFMLLQKYAKKICQIPKEKDYSDGEYAIMKVNKMGFDEIVIYGGLGKRWDHSYLNLRLLEKYPRLVLKDTQNEISLLETGKYDVDKKNYNYLSFMPISEGMITIQGVKYSLNKRKISETDTYLVSNEILEDSAQIELEGKALLFLTKD